MIWYGFPLFFKQFLRALFLSQRCASFVLPSSPHNSRLAWWRSGLRPLDTSSVWHKAQTPSNYYYYYYYYYYKYYYYYYYNYYYQ